MLDEMDLFFFHVKMMRDPVVRPGSIMLRRDFYDSMQSKLHPLSGRDRG